MATTKEYTNGEITIIWQHDKCIHSANCVNGLPLVFQPDEKPWIKVEGATTEQLISQIDQCPSKALSYFMNNEGRNAIPKDREHISAKVLENGPLMINGTIDVALANGNIETREKATAFCRCGASANKPYCDGSHKKVDFKG